MPQNVTLWEEVCSAGGGNAGGEKESVGDG